METTSARPYFAVFAIVAILVAAFILKQEYATADQAPTTTTPTAPVGPQRGLVKAKHGVDMVPEPLDEWFKRVGYQQLGFDNQQQSDETLKMLSDKHLGQLSQDQKALIRTLEKKPQTKQFGDTLIVKIKDSKDRKEFMPDVKALYQDGGTNQIFNQVVRAWYRSGDKDLILTLEKDPNKSMAQDVSKVLYKLENPGGDNM